MPKSIGNFARNYNAQRKDKKLFVIKLNLFTIFRAFCLTFTLLEYFYCHCCCCGCYCYCRYGLCFRHLHMIGVVFGDGCGGGGGGGVGGVGGVCGAC